MSGDSTSRITGGIDLGTLAASAPQGAADLSGSCGGQTVPEEAFHVRGLGSPSSAIGCQS